jgi:hypothetical protein
MFMPTSSPEIVGYLTFQLKFVIIDQEVFIFFEKGTQKIFK